jgi:carbonic anhydrase
LKQDPDFFTKSTEGQTPHFLFIGCSDSRVPLNMITKTDAGDIFVHRNIANIVSFSDMNLLSVLQYSVEVLNVRHIIVCGHYNCGGVKAALSHKSLGLIDNWITHIKMVYKQHAAELDGITDDHQRERRLIELHVQQQARHLQKTSIVQMAQKKNGFPFVHAWVYDLSTGLVNDRGPELAMDNDFNAVFKYS